MTSDIDVLINKYLNLQKVLNESGTEDMPTSWSLDRCKEILVFVRKDYVKEFLEDLMIIKHSPMRQVIKQTESKSTFISNAQVVSGLQSAITMCIDNFVENSEKTVTEKDVEKALRNVIDLIRPEQLNNLR